MCVLACEGEGKRGGAGLSSTPFRKHEALLIQAGSSLPTFVSPVLLSLSLSPSFSLCSCWINVLSDTRWAFHGPVIAVILVSASFTY